MFRGVELAGPQTYYLQKPGPPAEVASLLRRCLDKKKV
jgi:hypothetical protein